MISNTLKHCSKNFFHTPPLFKNESENPIRVFSSPISCKNQTEVNSWKIYLCSKKRVNILVSVDKNRKEYAANSKGNTSSTDTVSWSSKPRVLCILGTAFIPLPAAAASLYVWLRAKQLAFKAIFACPFQPLLADLEHFNQAFILEILLVPLLWRFNTVGYMSFPQLHLNSNSPLGLSLRTIMETDLNNALWILHRCKGSLMWMLLHAVDSHTSLDRDFTWMTDIPHKCTYTVLNFLLNQFILFIELIKHFLYIFIFWFISRVLGFAIFCYLKISLMESNTDVVQGRALNCSITCRMFILSKGDFKETVQMIIIICFLVATALFYFSYIEFPMSHMTFSPLWFSSWWD